MAAASRPQRNIFIRIYRLYADGLCSMTLGRTLWKVIIIKLVIMFGVLKLFFFQDYLKTRFPTEQQRAAHVLEWLTRTADTE